MDYDGDGITDFVSGSYDPGDVYLFRGLGEGEYAAVELLKDRGILLSTDGPLDNVLKIKPPLVVPEQELGRFVEELDGALATVAH